MQQFWKVVEMRFSGIVGLFAGQANLTVSNLKTVLSIWNAIRNTSSLASPPGGGRQRRKATV